MLAATSLGAVWTSCSPDFGIQGVLDRFGQVKPKLLFAIEEYQYNGKIINSSEKIEEIVHLIPEIEKIVWIPFYKELSIASIANSKTDIKLDKALYFNDLLLNTSQQIEFEQASIQSSSLYNVFFRHDRSSEVYGSRCRRYIASTF